MKNSACSGLCFLYSRAYPLCQNHILYPKDDGDDDDDNDNNYYYYYYIIFYLLCKNPFGDVVTSKAQAKE